MRIENPRNCTVTSLGTYVKWPLASLTLDYITRTPYIVIGKQLEILAVLHLTNKFQKNPNVSSRLEMQRASCNLLHNKDNVSLSLLLHRCSYSSKPRCFKVLFVTGPRNCTVTSLAHSEVALSLTYLGLHHTNSIVIGKQLEILAVLHLTNKFQKNPNVSSRLEMQRASCNLLHNKDNVSLSLLLHRYSYSKPGCFKVLFVTGPRVLLTLY